MRSMMTLLLTTLLLLTLSAQAETALDVDTYQKPLNSDDDLFNVGTDIAPQPIRRNPITGKYDNAPDSDSTLAPSPQPYENQGSGDSDLFDINPGLGPAPSPVKKSAQEQNIPSSDSPVSMMPDRPLLDLDLPVRGMTRTGVEKKYGQPDLKNDPVGTPPISSWIYPLFTVYFESDYVIHAVLSENVIEKGATNR